MITELGLALIGGFDEIHMHVCTAWLESAGANRYRCKATYSYTERTRVQAVEVIARKHGPLA